MNYLRTGRVTVPDDHDALQLLLEEADFYQLREFLRIVQKLRGLFRDSTLLNEDQVKVLNDWMGIPGQNWDLIYRGSRDGFGSADFHRICDNKPQILVLLQSEEFWLFGGYSNTGWSRNMNSLPSEKSFLFTLTNPHAVPPTKFDPISTNCGVYTPALGPAFGGSVSGNGSTNPFTVWPTTPSPSFSFASPGGFGSYDLAISDQCHQNRNSTSNLGIHFRDTTGKGPQLFTGAVNIRITEIEVFKKAT